MRRRWVIHPFLLAIFPILSCYAHNVNATPPREVVAPAAVALGSALVVWLAFSALLRDAQRAGLVASLALALFFTAGQAAGALGAVLTYLSKFWVFDFYRPRPAQVIGPEALACAGLAYAARAWPRDPRRLTAFLNVFALILVSLPAGSALSGLLRQPPAPTVPGPPLAAVTRPGRLPDIYYIILDGYARSDVLRGEFGLDNAPFLERLERRGFFVARRSTANYCQTLLSLSSSLNMTYLDRYVNASSSDTTRLREWIGGNAVARTLEGLGYRSIRFATGFDETEQAGGGVVLTPFADFSAFQRMLLAGTPLEGVLPDLTPCDPYTAARKRTLYLFDTLPEIARDRAPTFTFAHVVSPHPPFIFGEDGEDVSPRDRAYLLCDGDGFDAHYRGDDYREGYRRQAAFLTRKVEAAIEGILANSPEPPLIILQSDHGSGMNLDFQSLEGSDLRERMGILNAYLFPDRDYRGLDEAITPVNTFRVVLNHFFGARLARLPDRSFFSTLPEPFRFVDVTDRVRTPPPLRP